MLTDTERQRILHQNRPRLQRELTKYDHNAATPAVGLLVAESAIYIDCIRLKPYHIPKYANPETGRGDDAYRNTHYYYSRAEIMNSDKTLETIW